MALQTTMDVPEAVDKDCLKNGHGD